MIHSSVFISFKPISSLGRLTPLLVHFSAVAISTCHLHSSKSDEEDPIETFGSIHPAKEPSGHPASDLAADEYSPSH